MQPSAQGIASLFMGNPGALAQRVQKDRETSPTGLPDDLRQLMALNIVTTENDAAKRQEAMNQLQSMAPPGSEPPTVADTLRQRAQQAIQARMVSEMQKQQAMQSMMGGSAPSIPPGVPQPRRQPQGIDELPVEFGMAGGGIVAFENGGSPEVERILKKSPRDRTPEENATLEQAGYRLQRRVIPQDSAIRRAEEAVQGLGEGIRSGVSAGAERLSEQELASRPSFGGALNERILRALGMGQVTSPSRTQETLNRLGPMTAPHFADSRIVDPRIPQGAQATSPATARPPRPAPAPAAQPPAQELMPPGVSEEMVLPEQTMSPVAMARADAERREKAYEERIGKPDTSQYDRLIAELERQKAGTAAPERGFAGLMEFLGQIAATPRGLSSMEAGALGARGVQALEREREAKRTGLIEKQIELEQKKIDANRQYAKDVFGVGTNEFDRMLKANIDILQEQGRDKRQARTEAAQIALEQLKFENDQKVQKIRFDYESKLRAMPTAAERLKEEAIKEYIKETPGATRLKAMQALGILGGEARAATPTDRLRAAQTLLQNAETKEEADFARAEIRSIMQGMKEPAATGGSFPVTVGGKTYTFPTQEAANKFKAEAGVK